MRSRRLGGSGHSGPVDGLTRAKLDLERGDARKARDRLKGLVITYPHNQEVRALLAEAYRRDRQWPEAGRWGYLMGSGATDRERAAFESHCAFGWDTRITESRLRRLLRVDDLAAIADDTGRAILLDLPHRRDPGRSDGPFTAIARCLAIAFARRHRR
jgi:hypothetical protein